MPPSSRRVSYFLQKVFFWGGFLKVLSHLVQPVKLWQHNPRQLHYSKQFIKNRVLFGIFSICLSPSHAKFFFFCTPKKRNTPGVSKAHESASACVRRGVLQYQSSLISTPPSFGIKNTVEIAQLWQHNRGNYTTPTIYQKKILTVLC